MRTLFIAIGVVAMAAVAINWARTTSSSPDWKYTTYYGHPIRIDPSSGKYEIWLPSGEYLPIAEARRRYVAKQEAQARAQQPIPQASAHPAPPQPLQWIDPNDPHSLIPTAPATANQVRRAAPATGP